MPSTILSDNGVSSGSAGLKTTASNDGILVLQTSTSGGTATNALAIDTSQNVGIGTSSPLQRLDVSSSSTLVRQVIRSTSSGVTNVALLIQDGTTGTGSDGIYLGRASAENYLWTYENEPWIFGTNNTERMRINAGAPILCLAGGNTSATGTGIAFPATQSASSDANTLDDYEEGTFTPTIGGSAPAGTGTYGTNGQIGRYQKVGNRCYFTLWLQWTNLSGAGGYLMAIGLPFTATSATNAYYAVTAYMDGTITLNPNSVFQAYVISGTNNVFLSQYTAGGSTASSVTLDSNAAIMLTGHYEVA